MKTEFYLDPFLLKPSLIWTEFDLEQVTSETKLCLGRVLFRSSVVPRLFLPGLSFICTYFHLAERNQNQRTNFILYQR